MRKNKILADVIAKAVMREKVLGYYDIVELIENILNGNQSSNNQ